MPHPSGPLVSTAGHLLVRTPSRRRPNPHPCPSATDECNAPGAPSLVLERSSGRTRVHFRQVHMIFLFSFRAVGWSPDLDGDSLSGPKLWGVLSTATTSPQPTSSNLRITDEGIGGQQHRPLNKQAQQGKQAMWRSQKPLLADSLGLDIHRPPRRFAIRTPCIENSAVPRRRQHSSEA